MDEMGWVGCCITREMMAGMAGARKEKERVMYVVRMVLYSGRGTNGKKGKKLIGQIWDMQYFPYL